MIRKLVCSVAILGLSLGLALAEEVKGRITKIDDKKVTVVTGKKDDKKTMEYDLAKDCKVSKMENKAKVELTGDARKEALANIDGKKGVFATVTVDNGKVTEIVLGGGKKKKDTN